MMNLDRLNINEYTTKYNCNQKPSDKIIEEKYKRLLKKQRFLKRKELVEIGVWKSPRQKKRYASNDDVTTRELTGFSFTSKSERARIGALLALNGVSYPLASVILHFAFPQRYPILDFRALWSLGWNRPSSYNFEFWIKYWERINKLSRKLGLSIRNLDKALWQYSKEKQKQKRNS